MSAAKKIKKAASVRSLPGKARSRRSRSGSREDDQGTNMDRNDIDSLIRYNGAGSLMSGTGQRGGMSSNPFGGCDRLGYAMAA